MQESYFKSLKTNWIAEWRYTEFRIKIITAVALFLSVTLQLANYFVKIQQRQGNYLNDAVLNFIPARDVSLPIFTIIYGMLVFMFFRILPNPRQTLLFTFVFVAETCFRMTSIYLVPLNPPKNLVDMHDKFAEMFIYVSDTPITKDLFFSGHTATMVIIFLMLRKRSDKIFGFIVGIILAFLLLTQHVHYTIDVFGAVVFTYLAYFIAQKLVVRDWKIAVLGISIIFGICQTVVLLV
jgi:PAP2 superfamily C-terminal